MTPVIDEAQSREQLDHFADHGWVLLEGVLDQEQCQAYIDALVRSAARYQAAVYMKDTVDTTWLENLLLHEAVYQDWFELSDVLRMNWKMMGSGARFDSMWAGIKVPHPDRHTRRDELLDPDTWGWHRNWRPKWGLFADDENPRHANAIELTNATYLTPVSADSGTTAVLDGSHKLEGDYQSLKGRCEIVQPDAPAGSVLIFSETLVHSAVPIVSETTRFSLFHAFTASWIANWPGYTMPDSFAASLKNDGLQRLLAAPTRGLNESQFASSEK